MTRVLVTGGAGFIGGHLVERLLANGASVAILDDFSTGKRENLAAVWDRIDLHRGDVCDAGAVSRALDGCDRVVHLAAISSVSRSIAEPIRSHAVNLDATVHLLESCRRAGVQRLVFASSAAVYGDAGSHPCDESQPTRPRSPYAIQKLSSEMYCRQYAVLYGLETVALRFFNVYGPRQDRASDYAAVVPCFVDICRRGEEPIIYGDGVQTRDFVFVGDAIEAVVSAVEATAGTGSVFNVATGRPTTVLELLSEIRILTGSEVPARHERAREGDLRDSIADVTKAREILGFESAIDLREGLSRILAEGMER